MQERDVSIHLLNQNVSNLEVQNKEMNAQLELLKSHFGVESISAILRGEPVPVSKATVVSSNSSASALSSDGEDSDVSSLSGGTAVKKRKRKMAGPAGMVVMATTAMCACIGALLPSVVTDFAAPASNVQIAVLQDQQHERRRLMESNNVQPKDAGFVISPLEHFPDLWNVEEGSVGPWIGTRSTQQIYDSNNRFESTSLESMQLSMVATPTPDNNFLFCPDAVTNMSRGFLDVTNINKPNLYTEESTADVPTSVQSPTPSPMTARIFGAPTTIDRRPNTQAQTEAPNVPIVKDQQTAAPYMKLLVPASSFPQSGVTGDAKADEPWIEIGCEVKEAKLLYGADFIMAS